MKTRLLLLAVIGAFGSACIEPAKSAVQGTPAKVIEPKLETANVRVKPVELESLTEHVTVSGQTLASARVTYSAETAGRVEYLAVPLGAQVKKGRILARIDYRMLKAQADAAHASYELARKTYERVDALKSERLASQQQIDEVRSRMVQAEAQMRITDANLEKSLIRATRSGTITNRACEVGEFVMPGTPVYELVDYSKVEVQAQLPERLATRVKAGEPATVRIDALGRELQGRVSVIVPAAARVAKTFELRVEVDNPELKILVGMAATVRIEVAKHDNAVVAPQDIVIEEAGQRSVFVEADGVAHKRPVVLGPAVDGRVILEDGVKEGDRLVVVGQRTLVDGQPVRVLQ